MTRRVLITGGGGFIGSHLTDELLARGYQVRILDSLVEQVHGADCTRPPYLSQHAEFIEGDVRDPMRVERCLDNVDMVVHFAARVGVGQSMYQPLEYIDTNNGGTAVLMEALSRRPVEKLLVASSMSVYGEGLYLRPDGRAAEAVRTDEQLLASRWNPTTSDGHPLTAAPTPEDKRPAPASVYALSKYDQEQICLMLGRAYGISTTALRFFNVYGDRQALSNPYTGVLAIFAARLLNGNPPLVFEDGEQRRDFVHVKDVARACRMVLESDAVAGEILNIGSGHSVTVREIGERLARVMGINIEPQITQRYRKGDIRHCFADTGRAATLLGYEARVGLDEGLAQLSEWLAGQMAEDKVEEASRELQRRGLAI